MNKVVRLFTLALIATGFAVFSITGVTSVQAQTAGNGVKVSPIRSDITIKPGESKTITLTVQNITGAGALYEAIVNDIVPSGEAGQPALILDADKFAPSHSLKRFIAPVTSTQIDAGKTKDIKVTINVPKDTAGGGYYGAVRFAPNNGKGDKNVTLAASVGSIILVKVPGDIKEDMVIDSFDTRKGVQGVGGSSFFTTNKDLYSVVRFKNRGNSHEQPFGKIRLLKAGKVIQESEINNSEPRGNVLPDSVRRFDTKLDKVGSFGQYTVEGNFGYGTSGQLMSAKTSFWVIPIALIVAVIAAIAIIIASIILVPRAIKRYNRNVVRKAGRR